MQRWSKLVENWHTYTKWDKKQRPKTERLHLLRSISLADSDSAAQATRTTREIEGKFLMGGVRASGAPDSRRKRPETTHEVFSWTQRCERAAPKTPKMAKIFRLTRVSLLTINSKMATAPIKRGFHRKFAGLQTPDGFLTTLRKTCETEY